MQVNCGWCFSWVKTNICLTFCTTKRPFNHLSILFWNYLNLRVYFRYDIHGKKNVIFFFFRKAFAASAKEKSCRVESWARLLTPALIGPTLRAAFWRQANLIFHQQRCRMSACCLATDFTPAPLANLQIPPYAEKEKKPSHRDSVCWRKARPCCAHTLNCRGGKLWPAVIIFAPRDNIKPTGEGGWWTIDSWCDTARTTNKATMQWWYWMNVILWTNWLTFTMYFFDNKIMSFKTKWAQN